MNHKIIENNPSIYYSNSLIKEPTSLSTRTIRVILDSRERNITLFPNPNSYEINLLEDIQSVTSIRLISADIPFDSYIVNSNNNILYVAYNNTVYTVVIDTGNYTTTELATELTNNINNNTSTTDFVVTYDIKKDNFKFCCKNAFGLVFRGNNFRHSYLNSTDTSYSNKSMGRLLGFGINNYMSTVQVTGDAYVNVLHSEFKKKLYNR